MTQERALGTPTRAQKQPESSIGQLKETAIRLKARAKEDHLIIVAAGIAFFFFLALVPGLGAVVAIYGLVADPEQIINLVGRLSDALPGGGQNLIVSQLREAVASTDSTLGWGPILGVTLALWSASTGTTRMITALNIAYDRDSRSGFAVKRGVGIVVTLCLIAVVGVGVFAGSNVLSFIDGAGLPRWMVILANVGFWLVAAAVLGGVVVLIYRHAPNREEPAWRGVFWGAATGVGLTLLATLGLRLYIANFSGLSESYGSLTTIVVALFYLFIIALAVLSGAEVDADLQKGRSVRDRAEDHS